jgi:hypothetical protein
LNFKTVGVGYKYSPPEFVPLDDRRFVTVDVDLTEGGERISGPLLPRAEEEVGHSGLGTDRTDDQTTVYPAGVAKTATVPADSLTPHSSVGGADSHAREEGPRSPTPETVWPTIEEPGMRAPNPASNRERSREGAKHGRAAFGVTTEPDSLPARGLDETDQLAAAIAERLPLDGAVLRVRYTATEQQHRRIDQAALLKLIADAGVHKLYGGLQWIPVREQRARAEGLDESLGPIEALEMWLRAEQVGDPEAGLVRELLRGWLAEA